MNVFSLVTHARLISRDTFQMRLAEGRELYINEMLHPVLQGYDSYKIMADISIVGTDQLFNESIGRLIQEKHKNVYIGWLQKSFYQIQITKKK